MSNDMPGGRADAAQVAPDTRRSADSAERAYRAIRRQLVEFKVKPEERINEVHLARMLELSRTPIREALNRLASEGFVVFAPNRGFFFRGLDIDDLIDLFELRMIVETGAFALLCERADEAGLDRLRLFWADAKQRYARRDADEILELDEGFHELMAELSGNPAILHQLKALNARIRFVRRVQIEHAPQHVNLVEDHSRIVEAALARDAAAGVAVLKKHISMTVSDAQAALKEALLKLFVSDVPAAGRRRGRAAHRPGTVS
ncbi:GntR family transcriptional regulator [Labrys wisconsinensis]|uniref:DNA-binding GntR family transcriptional regulator n=1 Tax=Labrys wisconsinensis TaxID=425677 RepID=A0ABU0J0X7_9HYPH|nr:GntR family transcriptional regulator [Labrys wisconsinensis]MDQ0467919.1 DNA-binding GntR family transcriptional regulator [Labrys wisconsinensis]